MKSPEKKASKKETPLFLHEIFGEKSKQKGDTLIFA